MNVERPHSPDEQRTIGMAYAGSNECHEVGRFEKSLAAPESGAPVTPRSARRATAPPRYCHPSPSQIGYPEDFVEDLDERLRLLHAERKVLL